MPGHGARTIRDMLMGPRRATVANLDGASLVGPSLTDVVERAATTLRTVGASPEAPVAIVLANGPASALAFFAAANAGAAAPLNPVAPRAEIEPLLASLGAVAVIVAEHDEGPAVAVARTRGLAVVRVTGDAGPVSFALAADGSAAGPRAHPAVTPRADDVALLLHTSGTTARPKLVALTQANLVASATHIAQTLDLGADDHCLNVMPLFHVHGLVACLLASLAAGARVTLSPGFDGPLMLDWMRALAPTWYSAVPTMHQALLARIGPSDGVVDSGGRLRMIRSSSASLPPSVLAGLEAAFGVPVVEAYGMTEAAHQICSNPLPPGRRVPGSVGPAAGPEVRVVDDEGAALPAGQVGEVVIRGSNVIAGYLGDEHASHEAFVDGWFRTGDQGVLDADDYLTLVGRSKEIINRGGETISPREIDDALLEHPAIGQAVTFAVPDARLGEQVAAAVVPAIGAAVDAAEIRAHVASLLAPSKVPVGLLVVDGLPTGPTGKVQRVGLAERLGIRSVADLPSGDTTAAGTVDPALLERLRTLWCELLRVEPIGLDDHFLDLGGDSMLATQLLARVRDELAPEVDAFAFFDAPTVRAQAQVVADATGTAGDG